MGSSALLKCVDAQGLVQVTPAGVADPSPLARNPNTVEPPGASVPLYDTFRTATAPLVPVFVPFQICVMACPAGIVNRTVHPLSAEEPADTVTFAWKPPGHEFVT